MSDYKKSFKKLNKQNLWKWKWSSLNTRVLFLHVCVPPKPPNVILLLEWGIVRVKCLVQEHSMMNSDWASSFLEFSKWIEVHWPTNHKVIAFPVYSCSRATINYFLFIINNFGKTLPQLYHVLKLVLHVSAAAMSSLSWHFSTVLICYLNNLK